MGYRTVCGYDVAPDSDNPWRNDFRQVVLEDALRETVQRLNPKVPSGAHEDLLAEVRNLLERLLEGEIKSRFSTNLA